MLRASNIFISVRVCFPNGPKEQTTGGGGFKQPSSVAIISVGKYEEHSLEFHGTLSICEFSKNERTDWAFRILQPGFTHTPSCTLGLRCASRSVSPSAVDSLNQALSSASSHRGPGPTLFPHALFILSVRTALYVKLLVNVIFAGPNSRGCDSSRSTRVGRTKRGIAR